MKKKPESLEELVTCCTSSGLTSSFPRSLMMDKNTRWKLISGFTDGSICRCECVSCPVGGELVFRVTWESSPGGECGHIEPLVA